MAKIRIEAVKVKNYRSFGTTEQSFLFPQENLPIAIIGYNNCGKTTFMNALKLGLYESVKEDTFELKDFHNTEYNNSPFIELSFSSTGLGDDKLTDNTIYTNTVRVNVNGEGIESVDDYCNASSFNGRYFSKKWAIKQNAPIYYINFHNIKDEISTQKTSWGNLKSFLARHIKKIIDSDNDMKQRKNIFKQEISDATDKVLRGGEASTSKLQDFIERIKKNYNQNLRDNAIEIDFSLPDYEDIFLQMMFKIGLNGDHEKLVPIDHFGDGYISMFVMAVIQSIAEENTEDKALFLFEEPESFLHENHQEYFYKAVLCKLAEKGHQVIYTTHSARMIDLFNTKGIIKLEMNESHETIKKYNNVNNYSSGLEDEEQIIPLQDYNSFIKTIEPNLNKILFSDKILLVEGPNDLLVYKYIIKKKVMEYTSYRADIEDKEKYAETFLNYNNIVIIPHHGKSTAIYLIDICNHFGINYFAVNDWDFDEGVLNIDEIKNFDSLQKLKESELYNQVNATDKGKITTNYRLLTSSEGKIHFNISKLEILIGYSSNDKNPIKIYQKINNDDFEITEKIFPQQLEQFLGLDSLKDKNLPF